MSKFVIESALYSNKVRSER